MLRLRSISHQGQSHLDSLHLNSPLTRLLPTENEFSVREGSLGGGRSRPHQKYANSLPPVDNSGALSPLTLLYLSLKNHLEHIKKLGGDADQAIEATLALAEKELMALHGIAKKDVSDLNEEAILTFRKCLIAIQLVRSLNREELPGLSPVPEFCSHALVSTP